MKVFGFAGYSGSGKTTLIERVLSQLIAHGLQVSVIKHTHHDFDLDRPGKDSYRHRVAGATEVLLVSDKRYAVLHELRDEPRPTLDALLARLVACDLVLVEGYKRESILNWKCIAPLINPGFIRRMRTSSPWQAMRRRPPRSRTSTSTTSNASST